jgi:hypothetical protein
VQRRRISLPLVRARTLPSDPFLPLAAADGSAVAAADDPGGAGFVGSERGGSSMHFLVGFLSFTMLPFLSCLPPGPWLAEQCFLGVFFFCLSGFQARWRPLKHRRRLGSA